MKRTGAVSASAVIAAIGSIVFAVDAFAQGGYGVSVAASGDVLYVAEPLNIARPGTVYAYLRDAEGKWVEATRLRAPAGRAGDRFAQSVAASGDVVLIGYPSEAQGTGAAHAFLRSGTTWRHVGRLAVRAGAQSDSLGIAVALDGDFAAVSAPGARSVYIFRRDDENWSEDAQLTVDGLEPGDRFGVTIAAASNRVVVGVPGQAEGRGGAYVFIRENGDWREAGHLVPRGATEGLAAGTSVAIMGDRVIIGAPGRDEQSGAAYTFRRNSDGNWTQEQRLQAFDGGSGVRFGVSLAAAGTSLWVGAPGRRSAYRFVFDTISRSWQLHDRVTNPSNQSHTYFATAAAASDRAAIFGIPDILGTGTALAVAPTANGDWSSVTPLRSEPEEFPAVTGQVTPCSGGMAASFSCGNVELLSYLPPSAIGGGPGVHLNDVWGWTDPETGREYALVGRSNGTSFVDVTDPSNPRYIGDLPLTDGARPNLWRDIKVYRDHAFIVADQAGEHGVQVFDLRQLRNVESAPVTYNETVIYRGINSSHNIVINEETGLAVAVASSGGGSTCGGGLHMIDIREPTKPVFAGCFSDPRTGMAGTGQTHDAQCITYNGPDEKYVGREICFGSNETALSIADVTDRENPIAVARASYPNVQYSHQGWVTDDHRFFYMNDEGDETAGVVPRTRTLIWDIEDLDDPVIAGEFLGTTAASDHNLYVRADTMYQSNYASGLRIIEISDRTNPREIGFFDSVPNSNNTPGYFGSWSNYPYFTSGTIVFTSIREGLFIVRVSRPVS